MRSWRALLRLYWCWSRFLRPAVAPAVARGSAGDGIVTLTGRHSRQNAGKLLFVNGKFADAQAAHLRGVEAVYQLLERPVTGVFAFVPNPAAKAKAEVHDVMGCSSNASAAMTSTASSCCSFRTT